MVKTDDKLVKDFLAGYESAFVELVKRYNADVYKIIYGMTGNKEDSVDLAQDTFLQVYRYIHSYKSKDRFFSWLYKIALNVTRNYLRRKKIAMFFSLDWLAGKSPHALIDQREEANIETSFERKELKDIFDDALDSLDYKSKEILVLKEVKMLEYKEIACLLDIEIGTVKSRISRARDKLKKQLIKRGANTWM